MRRPRRPLRGRIRPLGPQPLDQGPRRLLQRAHKLMENGNHTSAAAIFERLARGAHDRGRLQHAPSLYLQAGRANLLAGEAAKGIELVRQGLGLFAETRRWPALHRMSERVVDELRQFGHPEAADEIAAWVKETLPEPPETYALARPSHRPKLPLKCPFCGGTIRPDEVEMLDAETGECPYCGSAVREG